MSSLRYLDFQETIIALATPPGKGAIAVLRISGKEAISITNRFFKGKNLEKQPSHTVHFGVLVDGEEIIDEVLVTIFIAPKSYTGENVVEISCHGSSYIIRRIIELYLKNGVRHAKAGEFTQRAFLNGKLDLAQAEAVADLIACETALAHRAAIQQMRGGFSAQIKELRQQLIQFAALIELELDFSEEDVEFADRSQLIELVHRIQSVIKELLQSFQWGNVLKNGVTVVIVGKPNAGKSTLLNTLLNEEKAIVSEIAGTTRDCIEDEVVIEGHLFRFIDTAGLREYTSDRIEEIGIEKTKAKMQQADIILYLFDLQNTPVKELLEEVHRLEALKKPFLLVGNKIDAVTKETLTALEDLSLNYQVVFISAIQKIGIERLKASFIEIVHRQEFQASNVIVTNSRHYEALQNCQKSLNEILLGLQSKISGDLLAIDIRQALYFLSEITGDITTEDLLEHIFSKFCIGK
ncbi:MAG: tRNA uridine-5-carboxymethylaminomethyl(34) synthesis GTPase MnmE [Cytophagales bacterium]|nr:tRNA uridine-5-carboxymethylaminomethyl(34) synthesis GTPase MnmE [Cytophagales bacterium]MDW8383329.1 tRNA uridine-5-carboxymethylaminomethyl(34) synthesis GTPase MnmE [Flammeovirgaceae bacterium]